MWIAKPVKTLSSVESGRWNEIAAMRASRGEDFPLGQTLPWAEAMQATGIGASLVFSPDEGAGGIVFPTPGAEGTFECVNGPVLDWDDADKGPRQLATFAMAVTKLSKSFQSLTLTPRWDPAQAEARLAALPVEVAETSEAATILIPLHADEEAQRAQLLPRLQRTLGKAESTSIEWHAAQGAPLAGFAERMAAFGREKGFFVPPPAWFQAFIESGAKAWIATSPDSQILVTLANSRAHYLFGFGPAAALHWRAMRETVAQGAREYDLNGYVSNADPSHPYRGVSEFKEQFGGRVVQYVQPRICIE